LYALEKITMLEHDCAGLKIVALDGVPTGSQDASRQGGIVNAKDILLPTAGRAEFIVAAPPSSVTNASLVTFGSTLAPMVTMIRSGRWRLFKPS